MSDDFSLGTAVGLTKLSPHGPMILFSAFFWQFILWQSPRISFHLAPRSYLQLSPGKRLDWDAHVVSTLHAILILSLSLPILLTDVRLHSDRVFGYSPAAGVTLAIACGYFLWDTAFSLYYIEKFGKSFFLHGVICFLVYLLSFKPYLMYYGIVFLSYELSTPFLNAHWFMDKTGWTGSRLQLCNGIVFLTLFLSVRIVFGFYTSYLFFGL
jgi:hypothetical protein